MDQTPQNDPIVIVKSDIKKPSFFKRIRSPFSAFSSPNKKIASAILSVLLVFGIGVGVYVAQRPTQLRPQAVAGGIDITLQPSTIQSSQNQNFTVDVSVNAKTHKVTGAEFSVNYDPAKVQFVSGSNGTFLATLLGASGTNGGFTQSTGSVKFTKLTDPGNTNDGTGSGVAARLTFKALQNSGSTQITLNNNETQAAVVGQDSSWIENLGHSTVSFSSTSGTAVLKINAPNDPQNAGSQFSVTLTGRSDAEKSNLFVSRIIFPTNLLEVTGIDEPETKIEGSNMVEAYYDNTAGEISVIVGIPNGYQTTQNDRDLAVIHFRPKTAGIANIDFNDGSQIFSNTTNDNILQNAFGDSVTIMSGTSSPSPTPAAACNSACTSSSQCAGAQDGCTVCGSGNVCRPPASPSPSPSASTNCQDLKGDGNNDCRVNLQDLSILLSHFSATNPTPAGREKLDFNNDGRINTFDFAAIGNKLFETGVIRRRS